MSNIKFSVLIPVYNVERYLASCLNSVLSQTYSTFEIIIINDGSTDNSGPVCEEYASMDKRIKVFHQLNQGLVMARRNAIAKATGDYCLFLDSDDYWDSDLLITVHDAILEHQADLVIYKFKRVTKNGNYLETPPSQFDNNRVFRDTEKNEIFLKMINSSDLNNIVCKVARLDVIDKKDYDKYKHVQNGEDLLQSLPLIENSNTIVYLDKPLYNYRTVCSSITQTVNKNFAKDISIVRGSLLEYIKKREIDTPENLQLFFEFYMTKILDFIYMICRLNLPREEKVTIIQDTTFLPLVKEAMNFIDNRKMSIKHRIMISFINSGNYLNLLRLGETEQYLNLKTRTIWGAIKCGVKKP